MSESPSSARPADESGASARSSGAASYPGMPRWVKLGAIAVVIVVVLVLLVMVVSGGEHGPVRHVPSAAGTITIGSVVSGLR